MGSYDDGLGYFDKALKIAAVNPDAGYQFVVNEGRLQAFRGMGKLDDAERLANEIIAEARSRQKHVKETQALITAGTVNDRAASSLSRTARRHRPSPPVHTLRAIHNPTRKTPRAKK